MISMKVIMAGIMRKYKFTTNLKLTDLEMKFELTLKLANKHMVGMERRIWWTNLVITSFEWKLLRMKSYWIKCWIKSKFGNCSENEYTYVLQYFYFIIPHSNSYSNSYSYSH